MTTSEEWLLAFAHRLGVDVPPDQDVSRILDFAGVAAHASQRTAAPIACWLAAGAGLSPEQALAIAHELNVEDT